VLEGDHRVEPDPALRDVVPVEPKQGYDVREVITRIVDGGDFLEVQSGYAMNIVVGFARITGRTVGVIANQPSGAGGRARHQRLEQGVALHPLLQRLQHPARDLRRRARLPARRAAGVRRHHPPRREDAVRLLGRDGAEDHVILRKAYGGAYLAMCSKDLGADRVFAWPTAEIAVMGAEGAAEIVFRKEIEEAEDKAAKRKEMIEKYREAFSNPYVAAGRRLVDDVIEPADTRRHVAQALEYLQTKRELRPPKKHGLMPLRSFIPACRAASRIPTPPFAGRCRETENHDREQELRSGRRSGGRKRSEGSARLRPRIVEGPRARGPVARRRPPSGGPVNEEKVCRSPITGTVVRVVAQEGQAIQQGDILIVLEAMKMETNITAPEAGKIAAIKVNAGDSVKAEQVVVELE
jgi:biotin carboxyl carrier protein